MEELMPKHIATETGKCPPIAAPRRLELSPMHITCVQHLVGHPLATIERELILQTLKFNQGNRTRAADVLRISLRSLRDRDEQGATAIEYGLIAAGISVAIITVVASLGSSLNATFTSVQTALK